MTPIERAREAAARAYQTERGKWRVSSIPDNIAMPLTNAVIDAFLSALEAEGKMIVSCDSAERLLAANQVMRRMIEDVEARGVDLSAYADELNSLAAMFEADAMIAAASAYNMHEQQRDKPEEG